MTDYSYKVKRWEPDSGGFTRAVVLKVAQRRFHCHYSSHLSDLPRRRAIVYASLTRANRLLELRNRRDPVLAFSQGATVYQGPPNIGPYGEKIFSASANMVFALREEAKEGFEIVEERVKCRNSNLANSLNDAIRMGHAAVCFLSERSSNSLISNDQIIAVSDAIGFPEEITGPDLVFNASFFLMEAEDTTSYASAFGEPIGLVMDSGVIRSPALFDRSAILDDQAKWKVCRMSIKDMVVEVGSHSFIHGQNCEFHTRSKGHFVESRSNLISISGRTIHAYNRDGGIEIPDAGFVIETDLTLSESALTVPVNYRLNTHQGVRTGVQTGPVLVSGGKPLGTFPNEEFSRPGVPEVPPTDLKLDWDQTVAPRMGIGFDRSGNIIVIAVEGCNTGAYVAGDDSCGCTFSELAELFAEEDAEEALYLDGGGSAFLKIYQGMAIKPADRMLRPGLFYQRAVPTVLASET